MREIPIGILDVLHSVRIDDDGVLFECRVREGRVIATANLRGITDARQVVEARVLSLHPQPPHVFDLAVTTPQAARGDTLWVRLGKDARLAWGVEFPEGDPRHGVPPSKVDYFEVTEIVEA